MKRLSAKEFQDWSTGTGRRPSFVLVVESADSVASWITKSPDLGLQKLRDEAEWAKVFQSDVKTNYIRKKYSLIFKYPSNGKMKTALKTWDERWEASNWIDAVLTGDAEFMGYDSKGEKTEDYPDEAGWALINHLRGSSPPSGNFLDGAAVH